MKVVRASSALGMVLAFVSTPAFAVGDIKTATANGRDQSVACSTAIHKAKNQIGISSHLVDVVSVKCECEERLDPQGNKEFTCVGFVAYNQKR